MRPNASHEPASVERGRSGCPPPMRERGEQQGMKSWRCERLHARADGRILPGQTGAHAHDRVLVTMPTSGSRWVRRVRIQPDRERVVGRDGRLRCH